jgi:hypothetical protein
MRYEHQLAGDKWMIVDRRSGDAIGFVHSGAVAAQVVSELNKMESRRA